MKKITLLFTTLLLSSCYSDDDNNFNYDTEYDFNVIEKYWDQSFDKALELYETNSHAS